MFEHEIGQSARFRLTERLDASKGRGANIAGTATFAPVEFEIAVDIGADTLFVVGRRVDAEFASAGADQVGRIVASRLTPHPVDGVRILVAIRIDHGYEIPIKTVQNAAVRVGILHEFVDHPSQRCRSDPLVGVDSCQKGN